MEDRKKKTGEKKKGGVKKGRDVSPFSLIHYLASYLGGLSGRSETVSCRLGKGVRWSADNEPLAHYSQKFSHNRLAGCWTRRISFSPHFSLGQLLQFPPLRQCVQTGSCLPLCSCLSYLQPEAQVTSRADSGISPPCSLCVPAHGKH